MVKDKSQPPIGWGEIALPPDVTISPEAIVRELKTLTYGLEPFAPDFIDRLDERQPNPRYRNGLVGAVLTAKAMEENIPLADFLAGKPGFQTVKVNGFLETLPPQEAVDRVSYLVETGIEVVKLKCSRDVQADLERVAAVAEAFPTLKLRLDPNGVWDECDCVAIFKQLQKFPIEYIEEPIPIRQNLSRLRELRQIIPIAADHWGNTKADLEDIIRSQAVDRLVLKSQVCGGPDRTHALANAAFESGLDCTVTASLETLVGITVALHCAASLPNNDCAHGLHLWDYIQPNVFESPKVKNGRISLPENPGLGFVPSMRNGG
ncbi:MAG: mandelate racemase/muconate lactonizing enzyme family protein [Cyanobacteriota bacterium]|nr:mandelate racemase/muconate lactonizing enzyme family protein [Cyanobacteriota bacterium]